MLRNQGNEKSNIVTTLRTIEPYVLKAFSKEDLHRHPMSKISEIASRIPDVEIKEILLIGCLCKSSLIKAFRTYGSIVLSVVTILDFAFP